jgi:hypothetical protein
VTDTALSLFQIACVVVVAVTLFAMTRSRAASAVMTDYAALAISGFVGEETCIALYRHYAYAAGWHLRVDHVPLLIPLIWPLVIMSARDVVRSLFPELGLVARAAAVALAVVLDAALIEVLSVRAGLWSWVEPGLLDVPVVGLLGWGFFAFGASIGLDALGDRPARIALVLVLGPLATHALILASWWGLFRWTLRSDLGGAGLAVHAAFCAGIAMLVLRARARGHAVEPGVWFPRAGATALFVVVYAWAAHRSWEHGLVLAATATPYLASLRARAAVQPGLSSR